MSAPARLIVPRGYAAGKRDVRVEQNPFAAAINRRASILYKRWVGPVWKDAGPQPDEHPGRAYGATVASWISDLTELRKAIVLCEGCQYRFSYKRVQYYRDERFGSRASARCDGCREYTVKGRLYLPEERLLEPSGVARPGQCWVPK